MTCNPPKLVEALANLEAILDAYDAMFLAFLQNGGVQEYDLDTGQSKQQVKRTDLAELRRAYDSLWNRYVVLYGRLNGCNATRVRPAYC